MRPDPPFAGLPEIRRLSVADWLLYRDVRLRSLAADPAAFEATLEGERGFGPERWQERLRRSDAATWVALDPHGRAIGTIVAATYEAREYILGMWVEPGHRGHGLAGRLLDVAIAWIQEHAPEAPIYLDVNPRQEAAVRLYRSRRFAATGRSKPLSHTPGEQAVEMIRAAEV